MVQELDIDLEDPVSPMQLLGGLSASQYCSVQPTSQVVVVVGTNRERNDEQHHEFLGERVA